MRHVSARYVRVSFRGSVRDIQFSVTMYATKCDYLMDPFYLNCYFLCR